jgi:hypothetical protein
MAALRNGDDENACSFGDEATAHRREAAIRRATNRKPKPFVEVAGQGERATGPLESARKSASR